MQDIRPVLPLFKNSTFYRRGCVQWRGQFKNAPRVFILHFTQNTSKIPRPKVFFGFKEIRFVEYTDQLKKRTKNLKKWPLKNINSYPSKWMYCVSPLKFIKIVTFHRLLFKYMLKLSLPVTSEYTGPAKPSLRSHDKVI